MLVLATSAGSSYPPQHVHAVTPKYKLALVNLSILAIDRANLVPKTAPISSSLGMLVADSIATRVLEATRLLDIVPSYLE